MRDWMRSDEPSQLGSQNGEGSSSMICERPQEDLQLAACRAELSAVNRSSGAGALVLPENVPEWLLVAFKRQEGINSNNSRLHLMNFASKIVLNHRIVTLQQEVDRTAEVLRCIRLPPWPCLQLTVAVFDPSDCRVSSQVALELSHKIAEDRLAIAELEAKTEELTTRAGEAEESQRELHRTLTAQTEAIEEELRRQEQVLADHERDMASQQAVITRLRGLCFRSDLCVDAAILLAGIWISGMSLLQLPLQLVLRLGSSKPSRRSWLAQLFRTVFLLIFVHKARKTAAGKGLHSQLGSFRAYSEPAWACIQGAVQSRVKAAIESVTGEEWSGRGAPSQGEGTQQQEAPTMTRRAGPNVEVV